MRFICKGCGFHEKVDTIENIILKKKLCEGCIEENIALKKEQELMKYSMRRACAYCWVEFRISSSKSLKEYCCAEHRREHHSILKFNNK